MKKMLIFLLALLFFAPAWAAETKDSILNVSGSGSVMVPPDTAIVKLGVEVSRRTAQEAQSGNAQMMRAVMASITNLGISKENIQTAGFNIWPETKYSQNESPKVTGYRCANQVNVTVEDLTLLSRIIDSGIAAGANNIQGIQFSVKEDNDPKNQALQKAIKEAADKAKSIAQAAGVKLKGIRMITESGATTLAPRLDAGIRAMSVNAAETPVSSGLIEIRSSVSVVYEIE